jgi:hypothetical protein
VVQWGMVVAGADNGRGTGIPVGLGGNLANRTVLVLACVIGLLLWLLVDDAVLSMLGGLCERNLPDITRFRTAADLSHVTSPFGVDGLIVAM